MDKVLVDDFNNSDKNMYTFLRVLRHSDRHKFVSMILSNSDITRNIYITKKISLGLFITVMKRIKLSSTYFIYRKMYSNERKNKYEPDNKIKPDERNVTLLYTFSADPDELMKRIIDETAENNITVHQQTTYGSTDITFSTSDITSSTSDITSSSSDNTNFFESDKLLAKNNTQTSVINNRFLRGLNTFKNYIVSSTKSTAKSIYKNAECHMKYAFDLPVYILFTDGKMEILNTDKYNLNNDWADFGTYEKYIG